MLLQFDNKLSRNFTNKLVIEFLNDKEIVKVNEEICENYYYIINRGIFGEFSRRNTKKYNNFKEVLKSLSNKLINNKKEQYTICLVHKMNREKYNLFSVRNFGGYLNFYQEERYYDVENQMHCKNRYDLFQINYLDNYLEKEDNTVFYDCKDKVFVKVLYSLYNKHKIKKKKETSKKILDKNKKYEEKIKQLTEELNKININKAIINTNVSKKENVEMISKVIKAGNELKKVFNTNLFPNVNSVKFSKALLNVGKYEIFHKRIIVSSKFTNELKFNSVYFHEYGHHIYFTLSSRKHDIDSEEEIAYNDSVWKLLNKLFFTIEKGKSIEKIIGSTLSKIKKEGNNIEKYLNKRQKYLINEEEVFARMFEQLILEDLNLNLPIKDYWYFLPEEMVLFRKLLKELIDLYIKK